MDYDDSMYIGGYVGMDEANNVRLAPDVAAAEHKPSTGLRLDQAVERSGRRRGVRNTAEPACCGEEQNALPPHKRLLREFTDIERRILLGAARLKPALDLRPHARLDVLAHEIRRADDPRCDIPAEMRIECRKDLASEGAAAVIR